MLAVLPLALGPAAQNIIIMSTGQVHICTRSCGLCELLGWHVRAGVGRSLLYSLASASALRLVLACSSSDLLAFMLVLDCSLMYSMVLALRRWWRVCHTHSRCAGVLRLTLWRFALVSLFAVVLDGVGISGWGWCVCHTHCAGAGVGMSFVLRLTRWCFVLVLACSLLYSMASACSLFDLLAFRAGVGLFVVVSDGVRRWSWCWRVRCTRWHCAGILR